jgi:uncharacterized protein with HEPN domain
MEKELIIYLNWILDSINNIELYTFNMSFEEFNKDRKTVDASLMQLEHI